MFSGKDGGELVEPPGLSLRQGAKNGVESVVRDRKLGLGTF